MSNEERRDAVHSPCIQPADPPPLAPTMEIDDDFDQMLERSSLGSPVAKHIRAGLPEHLTRRIQKRDRSAGMSAQPSFELDDLVLMLVRMCQSTPTAALRLRPRNPGGCNVGTQRTPQTAMRHLPSPPPCPHAASLHALTTSPSPGHVLPLPASLQLPRQLIHNVVALPGGAACILQYLIDEGVIADVADHVAQAIVSAALLRVGHAPPALLRACATVLDRELSWPKSMNLPQDGFDEYSRDLMARSLGLVEAPASASDLQEHATPEWQQSRPGRLYAVEEPGSIVTSSASGEAVPTIKPTQVSAGELDTANNRRAQNLRLLIPWAGIAAETPASALAAMDRPQSERAIPHRTIEVLTGCIPPLVYGHIGSGKTRAFLNTILASSLDVGHGNRFRTVVLLLDENVSTRLTDLTDSLCANILLNRYRQTSPAGLDTSTRNSPDVSPANPPSPTRRTFDRLTDNVPHALPRELARLFTPTTTAVRVVIHSQGGDTIKPSDVGALAALHFVDPSGGWDAYKNYWDTCNSPFALTLLSWPEGAPASISWDPSGARTQPAARTWAKPRERTTAHVLQRHLLFTSKLSDLFRYAISGSSECLRTKALDPHESAACVRALIPRMRWSKWPLNLAGGLQLEATTTPTVPTWHVTAPVLHLPGFSNERLEHELDSHHGTTTLWLLGPHFYRDPWTIEDAEELSSCAQPSSPLFQVANANV